jgi:LysM repeat protein
MTQSGGKAKFISLDDNSSFEVQYNPKEFSVNKAVTWEESKSQGQTAGTLQFQKGAPMTATFDLVFDTTADGNQNVQTTWVNGLLRLTNAEIEPATGEAKELDKKRPHALKFQWGNFSMDCVIESVKVSYLMFSSTGDAVRARCSVQLKEWTPPTKGFADATRGGRNGLAAVQLVTVKGGETLSQVAAANGVSTTALASANGITDAMADCTGQTLIIPSSSSATASASASASYSRGGVSASASASASATFGRR